MPMSSLFARWLLLLFSLGVFSPLIHSSESNNVSPDYYYKSRYGDLTNVSPMSLCKQIYSTGANYIYSNHAFLQTGGGTYKYVCVADFETVLGGTTGQHAMDVRVVGTCSAPYQLDLVTNMCTLCPGLEGQEVSLKWPEGRFLSEDQGSFQSFDIPAPGAGCFDSCTASRAGGSGDPYTTSDIFPQTVYADYSFAYTGQSCDAADPVPPPFPAIPDPGDTGDGDIGGGTGGDTGGDTGGGSGGDTGGGDLGGGTTTPGGGDGSIGGGGDSGGGDTGGDTGGGDTGGGDAGGGDTGGNPGPGPGPGSGGGDGEGDGSSAGGLGCDQPLTCEGDPVQCAILKTQKEKLCLDREGADFDGHKSDIESLFSGSEYQRQDDEIITVPSFVTGITRFFPSGTCPADAKVSLSSFGGKTLSFSYEPICSLASGLGPLIVIAATVFAALYVGRAFGGE